MRRDCLAAAALIGLARVGFAQAWDDQGGRLALIQTPVAALPPIATSTIALEVQRGPALTFRYGYLAGQDIPKNNFAGTVVLPLAMNSTISLTGGASACIGCKTAGLFGVGADVRVYEQPFGAFSGDQRVTLGFNGDVGYGQARTRLINHGDVWSVALGMPVALVTHSRTSKVEGWQFVPFVTPGVGYGSMKLPEITSDGTRFMLASGLAVYNRKGTFAANFGAQYLAWRDGDITVGMGIVIGGR